MNYLDTKVAITINSFMVKTLRILDMNLLDIYSKITVCQQAKLFSTENEKLKLKDIIS